MDSQANSADKQVELSSQQDTEATARAEVLKSAIGAWIGSADTKATALLAVSGALLAVVSLINSFSGPSAFSALSKVLFVAFCLCDIGSIICSSLVLFPRTDRRGLLTSSGWVNPLPSSVSFFGDLSRLSYQDFVSALTDTGNRQKDSIEQAFVLSATASRKMAWMSWSVILIVTALTFLGGFVAAEGFFSLKQKTPESPVVQCAANSAAMPLATPQPSTAQSASAQPSSAQSAAPSQAIKPAAEQQKPTTIAPSASDLRK